MKNNHKLLIFLLIMLMYEELAIMGVKIRYNFYTSQIDFINFQTPSITHCHDI